MANIPKLNSKPPFVRLRVYFNEVSRQMSRYPRDSQPDLQESVKSLEKKLKKTLTGSKQVMGWETRREFIKVFCRNLYQIVSSPLEIPEVAETAKMQLSRLDHLLSDLKARIRFANTLPPGAFRLTVVDMIRQLNTDFEANLAVRDKG